MADKRVPTQFIDLKTQDFGPKQEDLGSRVQKVGKPPPTEFIQIPEHVRDPGDVILELHSRRARLLEKSKRLAKTAAMVCLATWDSAKRAATRAVKDAVHRNGAVIGRVLTLEQDTVLRARADDSAPASVELRAGMAIVVYPEIDAPEGWTAARAPSGELGYITSNRDLRTASRTR